MSKTIEVNAGVVVCPTCGTLFTKLDELVNVHSVGLMMVANCPRDGACIPCAALWHKDRDTSAKEPLHKVNILMKGMNYD